MKRAFLPRLVLFLLAFAALPLALLADDSPREHLLMDFGWRFHLGNDWGAGWNLAKSGSGYGPAATTFSDASWRRVDLPHDWAVELPFDPKADAAHGFHPVGPGFPENDVGWYRRTFTLAREDAGRRVWLEFDGAFRDTTVFVNGWFVGHHEGGYNSFRYDITDVANCGGENVVAVRVDASEFEGWFYEGAGLYRHVWLTKTAPIAIAPDGVYVSSHFPNNVPTGPADIRVETRLTNPTSEAAEANVTWQILAPGGRLVASARRTARVAAVTGADAVETLKLETPELWSPETPRLYRLVTTVSVGGATVDRIETNFGVRTVAFDATKGFLLNGQPYVIQGTCNHQDHAGVGEALPDRLQAFRIEQLKKMGANAYRTAHNPPTAELLDACDRLGMLVMDESRLLGSDVENMRRWDEQIRRDRNHPSVAIWSLANEEFNTDTTPAGARVATTMQDFVHRLDPTRPVTYNAPLGNVFDGIDGVIEVRGWSYRIGADRMDAYHAAHPQQPNVGSEQGSTTTTRGIYEKDPVRGYVTAYDDNKEAWSNTAEEWLSFFSTRPWLSGGFVWTGFDYRGEPTPYEWPCVNSHFGILDTCGFPKDNFWYYQSWWTRQPVLHLLPHWNWPGREGQDIDVRALSNCDEVELFLNGRSLGRQTLARTSTLRWKVPYAPGTLSAKGFKAGQLVAETKIETTGPAAAVSLAPDRATIQADGEDVSVVTVSIHDAQGRLVPMAGNHIRFELAGPGRIIGVGNGDPSCHEPDRYFSNPTIEAQPLADWRWGRIPNAYVDTLPERMEAFDDSAWEKTDLNAPAPLSSHQQAVFRTHFTATPEMQAATGVELWVGRIEGDAKIYLNGELLGPGSDPRSPTLFNLKSKLRAGENQLAIVLASYSATGGVSAGAKLRLAGDAPAPAWSRSVFNGLAQVIVQSSKSAGEIKLTARADGLEPATATITTEAVALRPQLP